MRCFDNEQKRNIARNVQWRQGNPLWPVSADAQQNQKLTITEASGIPAAVLVAVSIPIFINQLEKSRESTDLANFRAAKASIVAKYLTEYGEESFNNSGYYDAERGIFVYSAPELTSLYGKGTTIEGNKAFADPDNKCIDGYYRIDLDYTDCVVSYVVNRLNGTISLKWVRPEGTDESQIGDAFIIDPNESQN